MAVQSQRLPNVYVTRFPGGSSVLLATLEGERLCATVEILSALGAGSIINS